MDVQTETRDLPSFEKVYNEGNFDVYVIQDGGSEVEIEAESNLIPADICLVHFRFPV